MTNQAAGDNHMVDNKVIPVMREAIMTVHMVLFKVLRDATKPEIKAAVELMFKVQVESVQISNVKGKEKRFCRFMGRRRNWKKAYVCLKPGQQINFAAEA